MCHSPLIEAVTNGGQREELEALQQRQRIQQQGEERRSSSLPSPLAGILSQLSGTLLNSVGFVAPTIMLEYAISDVPEHAAQRRPPVDELMRSFVTFPSGLHEADRAAHPEAFAEATCRICLEALAGGADPVVMLPCRHCYHANCIKPWLQEHLRCPLCRASVISQGTAAQSDQYGERQQHPGHE
ncbi:hypothetical protein DQ04_04451040 [Trypanosoma grayi]|uniref:hypothetical protein n=1 Tax=Trypanosoma grayi TaxID=71804 RepID=UPI0004F4B438|nr:hypothetical protein DQ04_04451040 [Trypanosoma grayi]KEG09913.1 hypothetical protein DQ04_04451040 [Trypanosoma grayi]